MTNGPLSTIETIIGDARQGRMFILVDDEQRENEGDLVIPAQMATPSAINFMATHGRGLICLAMERKRIEHLNLPLMTPRNASRHQTAFTVSIEAREGVSTGISAPDRAHTIATAINPEKGAEDIVTPGHIFPLMARDGGVLVRAGHTEAAVDIARLAGLNPSGVICEIMREDGTMARLPDLLPFAEKHNLNIGTIADLIAYRLKHDSLVERTATAPFHSRHGGDFTLHTYRDKTQDIEHLVLVKGAPDMSKPVLVRMHALNLLPDVLGDDHEGRGGELQRAMALIAGEGGGILVLLREPKRAHISTALNTTPPSRPGASLREYGIGAQILLDMGVRSMILLSNSKPSAIALEGYDLTIVGHRPIE